MKRKNRFITGYAGLRALAVIGVILYHLNPNSFMGGYLGVPIFLVLSGYLVTDHMFHAYEERGKYDFKSFYLRRIKKLYPQMIALLWGCSAYILLFQQNLLAKLNQIVITNLLNVYNFWQIKNGQSYFERFASNESPFIHLWTMSIEGQFYIVWPLVIFLLVRYAKKKKIIFWTITALTLISALEMAILFKPGVDTSRIYYGTDTRFFSLGLGAMLAVFWPTWKLNEHLDKGDRRLLNIIGGVALIGILLMVTNPIFNPQKAFAYRGGMFLFSFVTMILVGVIAHPGSSWNRWLTNPVFNWIGSRSYGIYLYQFPVMIFFEDKVKDIADHVVLYHTIEVILILIIAELSYRFIEKPFGRIDWEKVHQFLTKALNFKAKHYQAKALLATGIIVFILGSFGIIKAPTVKAENPNHSELATQIKSNRNRQLKKNKKLIKEAQSRKKAAPTSKSALLKQAKQLAATKPVNKDFEKYGISQVDLQLAQKIQVTAIGDSVMAGSSQNMQKLMPHLIVDAAVSRQLGNTIPLFEQYKKKGALNDNVLIGLGTNGVFTPKELDQLMKIIGPKRHVFWINVHVPTRDWQDQVNNELNAATKKYPNLTIIKWHEVAASHPDWFYDDHTHPTTEGSKFYSAYVTKELVTKGKY
ncbi:acetyltransferase [Lactobacillus taiwanensis]|uniref:Acetyltransferase n=1 Tax=Lactobacillus taiwanensis TaxID=508451 RepID=A0A256LK86_9LACO|nr:acyltransferase family protein [Lactobacillus taiwanensis]OYR88738.1 acetyltransferase [Lactobacillus taiwanensis]OYR90605.1 acetyltransferase [Lactobacillus taiwanensis]OYR92892.1 acetyltransferase [Lactobacillus taiwanensis]OYR96739.1 acetyltransferase [Lactobacillus taiwanensis]OYS17329.1 acetyltransferase [Lactobacillus taiwanensis]